MRYLVWMVSNRSGTEMAVEAQSRREAIEIFAAYHGVIPSKYISARKV